MKNLKKYIGYIRVSNKDHETSLPAQEQKLREYALEKWIEIITIHMEEKSAFRESNRKVFKQMVEHLKQDDVDWVIFHKVDRSSRNMSDFALLEEFFDTKDILVIEWEFDTKSAQWKFMFRTFCNMAVWYSENLSEEVTLKMKQRLEAGYYPAYTPFWYRKWDKEVDKDWKKKYPNPNAKYAREMFELYDTWNYSFASIAKAMRDKWVFNSRWWKITKWMVERILWNTFYYWVITWTNGTSWKITIYKWNHEPIISKELFDRVKARREGRTTLKWSYGNSTYSRMFQCKCWRFLCPETPTWRFWNRNNSYLRCQNKECDFKSVRTDNIEDLILADLTKYQIK